MKSTVQNYNRLAALLVFIALPLLIWAVGDLPRRTFLKEAISLLTILSFSMMLLQFFLSRGNSGTLKAHRKVRVTKLHKIIGYLFVVFLLLHPFLIVVPRYFEAGIEPGVAFTTMLTTWDSRGIVLGLTAYGLMLLLGLSSLFRNRLGIKYTTWRVFHGILSILFITLATWHALELGRHIDLPMSVYMVALASLGVFQLLRIYLTKPKIQA
jgi:predicted ferric reductase